MIYFTKWPVAEIEKFTVAESIEYISQFRKIELERMEAFLIGFASYNLQSTRLAFSGKKEECERYLRSLTKNVTTESPVDLDDQFRGLDFGE